MKTQLSITLLLALGSTSVLADTPTKGAPAAPPVDAKKAPEPKKDVAKMPDMPKPDAQIADVAKAMTGTWKCTGKVAMDPAKPTEMVDAKATLTHKLSTELDKWWIQSNLSAPMGKMTYKMVAYTTYNPLEKKWTRYSIDNMGGAEWSSSTGVKDGKLVWDGDFLGQMAMGGSNKAKTRNTEDMTDPKNVKIKGEMSMDGKTWMTGHEMTCKK